MKKKLHITTCLLVLGTFLPLDLSATHIVGGEINYRCLGGNQYEVTLQLFRDCDTGVPPFDDPATVNILDFKDSVLFSFLMYLRNDDTLAFAAMPCSGLPPNACIHTTTYLEIVNLPFQVGGYQLVYSICCRNQDIINIIDPTSAEASYHAYISETALLTCNSGARFTDWPSFHLCNGEALNIDHSATDVNGDSITYELYTPFDTYPTAIDWRPPYNLNNMMGLPFPFAIHPTTGLLTGTPLVNGTFIVGICAKEYRNGQLISITRRDFQFIVTACYNSMLADFETDILPCNNSLIVNFNNLSVPLIGGAFWSFGDGTNATWIHPDHLYLDTGIYTIQLIAGVGTNCIDTIYKDISLYLNMMDISITHDPVICNTDSILLVAHNLYDHYNTNPTYTWTPTNHILSGQGTDSVWISFNGTNFTISAVAANATGCMDTAAMLALSLPIEPVEAAFDSIAHSCNTGLTVQFVNQSTASNNQFLWTFDGLYTSTDVHPSFTFADTGTHTVRLIAGIWQYCQDTLYRDIHLSISRLDIIASDSQIVCKGDTVLLVASPYGPNYHDIVNYIWTPTSHIIAGQGTDSLFVFANSDLNYTVIATNTENCKDTATAHVNITYISPALEVLAIPDSIFVGQTAQLYATHFLEYTYNWLPDTTLSAKDIHNPEAKPRQTRTYYLNVTNQYCADNDSVTVYLKEALCGNPVVFVPNAFSPNDDGHNDILMVNGNNITTMNMAIYNRWGQKVFETNDQNIGWDGSFKGQPLPPDVYGYYMQCTCSEGGKLFLKGNITILK